MSIISSNEDGASFSQLLEMTNATNGNLSSHLKTLEDGGYIVVDKFFEGRRPKSIYSLTPLGLEAFLNYIDELSNFVARRTVNK
jgi:DNA-binding HxlR family transcriptional regulator